MEAGVLSLSSKSIIDKGKAAPEIRIIMDGIDIITTIKVAWIIQIWNILKTPMKELLKHVYFKDQSQIPILRIHSEKFDSDRREKALQK